MEIPWQHAKIVMILALQIPIVTFVLRFSIIIQFLPIPSSLRVIFSVFTKDNFPSLIYENITCLLVRLIHIFTEYPESTTYYLK